MIEEIKKKNRFKVCGYTSKDVFSITFTMGTISVTYCLLPYQT